MRFASSSDGFLLRFSYHWGQTRLSRIKNFNAKIAKTLDAKSAKTLRYPLRSWR